MRGPKPKYPIALTTEEEQSVRRLLSSRKAPQGKVFRARILLAAFDHPEWSNQQIAQEAGTVDRVVRFWRRRWSDTRSIEDLPRSGRPRRFSP
jgi:transposase